MLVSNACLMRSSIGRVTRKNKRGRESLFQDYATVQYVIGEVSRSKACAAWPADLLPKTRRSRQEKDSRPIFSSTHSVWHKDTVVRSGLKYVLRTDVMYGPPSNL